jgi:hypothetical protein
MSHKAFYQTLYQTEQLFRFADERLTFPTAKVTNVPAPVKEAPAVVAVAPPAVAIVDPVVVPLPVVVDEPVTPIITDLVSTEAEALIVKPEPGTSLAPAEPAPLRPATPLLSQKVLILVDQELKNSELLFLEKILKSVNLDIAGAELLNVHGSKTLDFAEVLRGKYIHHFFTFGVPFTRLDLDILMDRYQPVRFEGITFLMADPLPVIEADVALKKKLWEALKKIFLWR